MTEEQVGRRGIPDATVARLPVYLRALAALADRGTTSVSSEELAVAAGVNSPKLRKDLSHLGSYGVRGVGYDVEYLIYQISRELGLTQEWPVAIVGVGNLGHALAGYGGFATRGFRVVALFDVDPHVVGEIVGHLPVRHLDLPAAHLAVTALCARSQAPMVERVRPRRTPLGRPRLPSARSRVASARDSGGWWCGRGTPVRSRSHRDRGAGRASRHP